MLQELAARSNAAEWAIGSMLFFLAMFVAIVAWVALKRRDEMDARARMPLDEGTRQSQAGNRDESDAGGAGRKPPAAGRKPE